MNRLQSELHRLYFPRPEAGAEGEVRAMVMELTRPADWEVLSKVWRGVQTELELPAPAIAVSGIDGLQLWFSLAEPIAAPQAHAFLDALRVRFLPDIDAGRFRLMTDAPHARWIPAQQEQTGNWSAFLAPDLAPVFADTPWLDIAPNEEGQAALLRGLATMKTAEFEAALRRLNPIAPPSPAPASASTTAPVTPSAPAQDEPRRFLLRVMNDDTVALALRIEAAKALLWRPQMPS
jgi:hypothetical protein